MWCFAIVNGRLAEIYFDGKGKKLVMRGHCYVKASEFKTAREQKYIRDDTAKYRLSFRNKWYRDMETGERIPLKPFKINSSEKTYTLEEAFPNLHIKKRR